MGFPHGFCSFRLRELGARGRRACAMRACWSHNREPPLSYVALEEAQRFVVELGNILVDWSVSTALEDHHLTPADAVLHRIREAGGSDNVVAAERDLGRGFDSGERRSGIVSDHRIGLAREGFERLCWTPAH